MAAEPRVIHSGFEVKSSVHSMPAEVSPCTICGDLTAYVEHHPADPEQDLHMWFLEGLALRVHQHGVSVIRHTHNGSVSTRADWQWAVPRKGTLSYCRIHAVLSCWPARDELGILRLMRAIELSDDADYDAVSPDVVSQPGASVHVDVGPANGD